MASIAMSGTRAGHGTRSAGLPRIGYIGYGPPAMTATSKRVPFTAAGGIPANYVAKWDGQDWIALGAGLDGNISDIVKGSDGKIYAAGNMPNPNVLLPGAFARWNGTTWQFLFNSQADQFTSVFGVYDLWATTSGEIAFGGSFGFTGRDSNGDLTVTSGNVAYYDVFGDSVGAIYRPDSNSNLPTIRAMVRDVDGSLLVGGNESALYKDIENAWARYALCFEPRSMVLSNDGLFIGGLDRFNNCVPVVRRIGVNIEELGFGVQQFNQPEVTAMAVDGQKLWVVGDFEKAGTKAASNISCWTIEDPNDTLLHTIRLEVRDYQGDPIGQESFVLYRVSTDRPN
ncbi:MAG: hypothetical protein IH878_08910, partial [Gemmatimonadetes bacterium]|nr:hypothetical protein [Gemmatimonadota bacterium]